MHVNRFIHWAFEGRSCFCATRLVLTDFSESRTYSTRVIPSIHVSYAGFRRFCTVSYPSYISSTQKMLRGWFCTRLTHFLSCYSAVAFHVVRGCMCFWLSLFSIANQYKDWKYIYTLICLSLDGFIWNQHNGLARLVVHYVGVVEVMGSNPAQASIFFFQALFSLLLLTL